MSAFKHLQAICGQYLLSTSTKLEFGNFFQKNREIDGRTSLHRFTNFLPFLGALFVWNVTMDTRLTVGFHHFPWKAKEMTQTTPQLWEIEN